MEKESPVWRPLFPHGLRPEARRAAAEYDIGPGEFANLCMRYVLDRLGKLPEAFALDDFERLIAARWDLAHSSLEQSIHKIADALLDDDVCGSTKRVDHG